MALARAHLETTQCDPSGRQTYYGLQALAFDTLVNAGEVLIRRRWRRSSDPIAVPVQFQVLEPDYLEGLRLIERQFLDAVEAKPVAQAAGTTA